MKPKKPLQILFRVLFVVVFLGLILSINFFHTEDSIQARNTCPACQFQSSALTTAPIPVFYLPAFTLLETLQIFEFGVHPQVFVIHSPPRSPPAV